MQNYQNAHYVIIIYVSTIRIKTILGLSMNKHLILFIDGKTEIQYLNHNDFFIGKSIIALPIY